MDDNDVLEEFLSELAGSVKRDSFVKLSLSRKKVASVPFEQVYFRWIEMKDGPRFQLTYRYPQHDRIENLDEAKAHDEFKILMKAYFKNADLIDLQNNWHFKSSKKGKMSLIKRPATHRKKPERTHDEPKKYLLEEDAAFLKALKISSDEGRVFADKQAKFRQIHRFLELVQAEFEHLDWPQGKSLSLHDMGSGKSYLTFALYHYFSEQRGFNFEATAVERREELVESGKEIAERLKYPQLKFVASNIQDAFPEKTDVLVALHACDTATDDAIIAAIKAEASLVFLAPCCQHALRKTWKGPKALQPLLRHGIIKEYQAAQLTDAIRSLVLEYFGYQARIIEFVDLQHTAKNLMISARKISDQKNEKAFKELELLMKEMGVEDYYLLQQIKSMTD